VTVYDVAGKVVRRLLQSDLPGGRHAAIWDGRDDRGRKLAPGVYVYQLRVNGQSIQSRKALLLR
jgi:flagellar hook assembly protein FlgD